MPKKQAAGAFYLFMLDYQKQQAAKGKAYRSLNEVSVDASPVWQSMSPEEKAYYVNNTKDGRKKQGTKYTSLGQNIEDITKVEREKVNSKRNMETYIDRLVEDGEEYVDRYFYVLYVNVFCHLTVQNRYLPAEITIVRFNLRNGADIEDILHAIIEPGKIPMGYRLPIVQNAKEYHGIPAYPDSDNYDEINRKSREETFKSILTFLKKYADSDVAMPPLYVEEMNHTEAQGVIKDMLNDFGYEDNYLRLYSLTYLFYTLRNAAHQRVKDEPCFVTSSIAHNIFEGDTYEFVKDIACKFHINTEKFMHCTMAKALRKIFLICDHTVPDLCIDLIPGRHVPFSADRRKLYRTRPRSEIEVTRSSTPSNATKPPFQLSADAPEFVSRASRLPGGDNNVANEEANLQRTRLPITTSRVLNVPPRATPNLEEDFPALEAPKNQARPLSMGRGRGRILVNNFNK